VTPKNLTARLREDARTLGIDWIGFCPAHALDGAPADTKPSLYLGGVRSVISIAYRLNYSAIQNLPASRSAYMLEHDYANRHLDRAAHVIGRLLEGWGIAAVGFDAGAGFYHEAGKAPDRFAADFSHKHAAAACGLGQFGLNNLLLSPTWGPRMRLTTVLTVAELEPSAVLEANPCLLGDCAACVRACPVRALDGWQASYDPRRGWRIDKRRCYDYIFTTLKGQRCGLCIQACPVGLEQGAH
jgi:epoxyqueuosine reductase QueG